MGSSWVGYPCEETANNHGSLASCLPLLRSPGFRLAIFSVKSINSLVSLPSIWLVAPLKLKSSCTCRRSFISPGCEGQYSKAFTVSTNILLRSSSLLGEWILGRQAGACHDVREVLLIIVERAEGPLPSSISHKLILGH